MLIPKKQELADLEHIAQSYDDFFQIFCHLRNVLGKPS